jgi:hypothetical protein
MFGYNKAHSCACQYPAAAHQMLNRSRAGGPARRLNFNPHPSRFIWLRPLLNVSLIFLMPAAPK